MNQEEKTLRHNIRQLIRHVKQKKLDEENNFRSLLGKLMEQELRQMISESDTPDVDPAPNKSTGINVLEELLKKIVPVLETDFKSLTTSAEQRESFRAHISNAIIQTLTPAKVNNKAGEEESGDLQEIELDIEEDVEVNVDDNPDADKFIDIRTDAEKAADEPEEEDPKDSFGADIGGDETGRNMAYQCFKKIENNIIDSYELLANPEDQELFFDYLLANVKMYFDKFEKELDPNATEPTNQAYDQAKQQDTTTSEPEGGGDFDLEI
tara:strand:- start:15 stop:815 length:801 start_codon:yes stop_codon:yes gene_type:complete